jgi:hypothetical protein
MVAGDQGHNMWRGFFECQELVDFVIGHATGKPVAKHPKDDPSVPKPIAHWQLDDAGAIALDSAGGHNGKIVGAKSTGEGKFGKALLFDRPMGNHVSIPYSKDFSISTFSVSAWVNLTREPTFSGILGTRFNGEQTFDMKVNDAKVHGDIGDGKEWIETKVNFYADDTGTNGRGGDLDLNRWYHIVFAIDSEKQECRLYLDADLKKTISFKGKGKALLMKPGQEMRIGNSSPGEFMDGIIDDVRIWDRALTGEQVLLLVREEPRGTR